VRRPCEICSKKHGSEAPVSDRYLRIETRIVALCADHASQVKKARITTLAGLQQRFSETTGARSLLTRRAASNRRVFPARPEGRRRSDGRRWDDPLHDG
jgi:hypothetical protein